MENKLFEEFVWAKVVGHPYWPATIIKPGLHTPYRPLSLMNQNVQLVYFCGTYEYAWINDNHIKPYADKKYEKFKSFGKKNKRLQTAIDEMDDHVLKKTENPKYLIPTQTWFNHNTKQIMKPSKTVKTEHSFGVIGIGVIGSFIAETLLKNGFTVNVWTRSKPTQRYKNLQYTNEENGGHLLNYTGTPRHVLHTSDTVFICISKLTGVWKILYDEFGLNNPSDTIMRNKGIILITTVDSKTSKEIYEKVLKKEGMFLDVLIHKVSSKEHTDVRQLVASGSKPLYDKCLATCFPVLGTSQYHEDLSYPAKMNQISISMKTTTVGGLAQGLALAKHLQVSFEDIYCMMPVLKHFITSAVNAVYDNPTYEDPFSFSLADMNLALQLSQEVGLSTSLIKAACEMLKREPFSE